MNFKKKGFSLIELLIVIAIFSVLLLISTDRFIIGAVKSNNNYNQEIDLQGGVKNSMDNIKNILKKSVQVHLVGKEVYTPQMDLSRLDKNYSYIAFREDGGNRFLANLVYNKSSRQFDIIPLMAIDKQDNLNNTDIDYNLKFYENDANYKKKMDKNSLTLTVEGTSRINGLTGDEANLKEFRLQEDFVLPNVNQILISRHLKGGINDITAIAYDDGLIKPKKKSSISLVFVIDASASMKHSMDNGYLFKKGNSYNKYTVRNSKEDSYVSGPYSLSDVNKYREWTDSSGKKVNNASYITRKVLLEYAINDIFLDKLDGKAKDNNLDISAYMFTYHHDLQHTPIASPQSNTEEYFYPLNVLESKKYGPYYLGLGTANLNNIKGYVKDGLKMKFLESDHNQRAGDGKGTPVYDAGTNTGWGLLQGFEILKQLELKNREDRYLILLTDGDPNYYAYYTNARGQKPYLTKRNDYNLYADKNVSVHRASNWDKGLEYIKYVADKNNYNYKGLYKTAYIVGFGNQSQLRRLGITIVGSGSNRKAVPFFKEVGGNPVPILKDDLSPNSSSIAGVNDSNSKNIFNYLTSPYDKGELFSLLTDADEKNDPYKTFMADDPETLKEALDKIVEDIVQNAGIFDGPDKMAP